MYMIASMHFVFKGGIKMPMVKFSFYIPRYAFNPFALFNLTFDFGIQPQFVDSNIITTTSNFPTHSFLNMY